MLSPVKQVILAVILLSVEKPENYPHALNLIEPSQCMRSNLTGALNYPSLTFGQIFENLRSPSECSMPRLTMTTLLGGFVLVKAQHPRIEQSAPDLPPPPPPAG